MSQERDLEIKVTRAEFKERLKKVFVREHSELMSECILDLLKDDQSGLESLCKSSMGIEPILNYQVGDTVVCRMYPLSDWQFDKDKMKEQRMIVDDCIDVTITAVRRFSHNPYQTSYSFIHKDSGETKVTTSDISESHIQGYSEPFLGDDDKIVSSPDEPINI